ncbi:hypothetical protein VNO78_10303 [Psophocarpus tetragonolobus]|uniref:NAB domain-containing protein n=1 Tax=Psophocarpus tetragonolobus TaxID=3891 RepID=A0AAN9XMU7_PSOTE
MTNHRSRESIKFFESLIDSRNFKELQRTKTDIENNISKILKIVKNESHSTEDGNDKQSTNKTELVGLMEDLYKKHQSLYALYDCVTEEFEKLISRRRIKVSSSSDSDSEYFSSEEVDGHKRRLEKEHHSVLEFYTPKHEFNRSDNINEALNIDVTKMEEQLNSLMKEVDTLTQQKNDLKLQVESKLHEVKHVTLRNMELHDQVLELESLLKEKKKLISDLQTQLNNHENQEESNVGNLIAKINELEIETKSLQTQRKEMEEKVKCDRHEASTQREDLMDQLNMMQQKLDYIEIENRKLDAEMESQREQISQDLIQIENLKDNLVEMKTNKLNMVEEKKGFLERLKDLELNMESLNNQKNELEEKLRDTSYENKQLVDENKAFQDRNHELRTAMSQKGEEISSFLKEHENHKNGTSMEVMALQAKLNGMKLELDTMHEQKNKLEQQNERSQKEYVESLAKMESLNAKLATQIDDQEKTMKVLTEENKQAKIVFSKLKIVQGTAERKMNELAEEFRRKMEDNIRLLHQRIHVAEQLNNENKYSCKIIKQKYKEENKIMEMKIASYKEERTACVPNGLELVALNKLNLAVEKVEEHSSRVTRIMCEVEFGKNWMRKRNDQVKELQDNVDCLKELLNKKEEQELLLRENVWKLEANVSKEGGEKLNLRKEVSQLEKKVGKLENSVKEKEEELVSLGEKKREAIRQLCFMVEFHRDRCNYLKDIATKKRINHMT